MPSRFLTLQQVAVLLDRSERTVHRLIKSNELSAFKMGKAWQFLQADVDEYIARLQGKESVGTFKGISTRHLPLQGVGAMHLYKYGDWLQSPFQTEWQIHDDLTLTILFEREDSYTVSLSASFVHRAFPDYIYIYELPPNAPARYFVCMRMDDIQFPVLLCDMPSLLTFLKEFLPILKFKIDAL